MSAVHAYSRGKTTTQMFRITNLIQYLKWHCPTEHAQCQENDKGEETEIKASTKPTDAAIFHSSHE